MKILAILMLLASVALNACFFAGCRSLHDVVYGAPCKFDTNSSAKDNGKDELVRIAGLLEIKTAGKSASDLSSDICYKLERRVDVPVTFDSAAFEKMAKDLSSSEEKVIREYQRFISDLQGKRVIVIDPGQ